MTPVNVRLLGQVRWKYTDLPELPESSGKKGGGHRCRPGWDLGRVAFDPQGTWGGVAG